MRDRDGSGSQAYLVGSPGYHPPLLGKLGRVTVRALAGGAVLESVGGNQANAEFGASVASLGDVNGDGHDDYAVGQPMYDDGASAGVGAAHVYLGKVVMPTHVCEGKTNSLGCLPIISYAGTPSFSVARDFQLRASNVKNREYGVLFYGRASSPLAFEHDSLCVARPCRKSPLQYTGGSVFGNDCSGNLDLHVPPENMETAGLAPGDVMRCQWWIRDHGFTAPDDFSLTDALEVHVLP